MAVTDALAKAPPRPGELSEYGRRRRLQCRRRGPEPSFGSSCRRGAFLGGLHDMQRRAEHAMEFGSVAVSPCVASQGPEMSAEAIAHGLDVVHKIIPSAWAREPPGRKIEFEVNAIGGEPQYGHAEQMHRLFGCVQQQCV